MPATATVTVDSAPATASQAVAGRPTSHDPAAATIAAAAAAAAAACLIDQNDLQDSLHQRHQAQRVQLIDALINSPWQADIHAAYQLLSCGSYAELFLDPDTARVRRQVFRCRHRLCPLCSRKRVSQAADQMTAIVNSMEHPRQLILTVKSNDRDLRDQVTFLRRSFSRLRRTRWWKDHVSGGLYTIEITLNTTTRLWHPHLHIIFEGAYLPHPLVQKLWHRITHGSDIVWLSDVADRAGMVRELVKYIGKPARLTTFTAGEILSYAHAVRGARMMQAFGTFHGLKLEDRHVPDPFGPDTRSVSISRLMYLAQHGSKTCIRILLAAAQRWPDLASYIYHRMPQAEPPESQAARQLAALARITGRPPPARPPPKSDAAIAALELTLSTQLSRFLQEKEAGLYDVCDHFGGRLD